ncbi:apolipoprotein N-acyltransferase [Lysobacter humi (ex Lee et al. 2017)]
MLAAAYARGTWPVGFVMLVPWLVALDGLRALRATLAAAVAMSVAFVAATLGWFAPAIADYTGLPTAFAGAVLLVAAPLLQPQFIAFALVRHVASRRFAGALPPVLAIAGWIAVEWAAPRLFGDTLGHGLQPSRVLRQGADLAGAAGLTLVLLATNAALATAVRRRRATAGAITRPLLLAAALPLALAGYGAYRLSTLANAPAGASLRIGLVQAAIVDYERLRRERGAYAVVREVLDTHYALSTQLRAQGADALVWPETVYPTTFGQPRSEAAAELDREIVDFVTRIGTPLVFGTYERDLDGEYVVAAFVDPVRGPLGAYRKTRLFPLTEFVPPAIDGAVLRRQLPWAGTWRPGDGARVFPLLTADGREIPVAPLVCRDDVDPVLARDGARLGAQLLVGLSNDAWFTRAPLGARLHLAVAAFRSIETRLPQVRATTNGMSGVVDATGEITARTAMGERATLLAEVRPREHAATLAMRLGDWLGPLALVLLAGAMLVAFAPRRRHGARVTTAEPPNAWLQATHSVLVLRPWQRVAIGGLRLLSRGAVLVLGIAVLASDDTPRMLAEIRVFALWVLVPEAVAATLAWRCRARLQVSDTHLVLVSAARTVEIDRAEIAGLRAWRLPWPGPGFDLVLGATRRWTQGIALRSTATALRVLSPAAAGPLRDGVADGESPSARARGFATRRRALHEALEVAPWRVDRPFVKFVLFPLMPALPAFRLHQVIAYGGPFSEYYTFGARAYLAALLLWWASWAVKLVLLAGGLRLAAEMGTALALIVRPRHAAAARRLLLAAARVAYFAGVPAWLAARLLL